MNLDDAWAQFFYAVQTSGRPRVARSAGMTDAEYCAAEIAAGTPQELARKFAGLPAVEQGNGEPNA